MDLGTIGTSLLAAFAALSVIGGYLGRQSRADRRRLRHLEAVVQAYDLWSYELRRQGFTLRGRTPPPAPKIIEALHDDPDPTEGPPEADPEREATGRSGPGRPRHAVRDG